MIYIQKGLEGTPEVFIDPNQLSPDGTVRDRPGRLLRRQEDMSAISRGEAGSDWSEIRVLEIATKKELPDRIQWDQVLGRGLVRRTAFSTAATTSRPPGKELTAKNEFQKVFYHKLGDPQEKDALVYEDKEHPLRYFGLGVSEDERYAFLTVSEGTSGNGALLEGPGQEGRDVRAPDQGLRLRQRRHRQRRRQVPRPDQRRRAQLQGRPDRSQEARQGELADGHPREARGPGRGQHGRRAAVRRLPQGRQHEGLSARARRQARPGDRASGARHGRRIRRLEGRQDRSSTRSPRSPSPRRSTSTTSPAANVRGLPQGRGQVQPRGLRGRSRSSTRARTRPRSRCSSSTRRAWPSTARTPAS